MDFSKFDAAINKDQLQKDYEEAKKNGGGDYEDLPKGKYTVFIEKMEIKETKTDGAPMFSVQCRTVDALREDEDGKKITGNDKAIAFFDAYKGEKKPCMFFNRKIYGNKESDKWNDGKAIAGVCTWLDKLETETVPEFESYSQFNDCVLDIFEECEEYGLLLDVEYDPDAFNPIKILDVYEEEGDDLPFK